MKDQESSGVQPDIDSSPFQETVAVECFFGDGSRREIITDMLHAIAGLIPVIVLTGDEGSGKTLMCRVLEDEVPPNCIPVLFPLTVESFEGVVRILAREVGLSADPTSRTDIPAVLDEISTQLGERNERLIVIFDQAEQIYLATLERIRKMLDQVNESGVVMQVVMAGRSMLTDNLNQLSICNFAEAEEKHYTLEPLSSEETFAYLRHASGLLASAELLEFFTPEISDKIYNAARGNFRMTNILAEEALKNQAHDASFWVLLDNVEKNDGEETPKGTKKLILPGLPRISSRLMTYVGGAVFTGLLLLWFFSGKEQQTDITPEETVAMVQPGEPAGRPEEISETVEEPAAEVVALVPEKVKNIITAPAEEVEASPVLESEPVIEQQDVASVTPAVAEDPALAESNIVISSLTQSDSDGGEINRVREAVQVEEEDIAELADSVDEQVEGGQGLTSESAHTAAEPVQVATTDIYQEPEVPEQLAPNGLTDSVMEVNAFTTVAQETEPEPVADIGPPVSDRLPVAETIIKEEKITEIRQTRPVKVKVEQLKQIEKTREKIKVPVVAQVIVPEESADEVDLIYNRRVAAGRPWLSGQNHNLYTVQLMVLTSDTAEKNFKQMLGQENYRQEARNFFIFQKDDAPSTLMVFYGEYATMTDARNARNNIPVFLRGHKPYAISVQGAMRKVKFEQ